LEALCGRKQIHRWGVGGGLEKALARYVTEVVGRGWRQKEKTFLKRNGNAKG